MANTDVREPFKKSTLSCYRNTVSITMNVTCDVDSGVATRRMFYHRRSAGLEKPA